MTENPETVTLFVFKSSAALWADSVEHVPLFADATDIHTEREGDSLLTDAVGQRL